MKSFKFLKIAAFFLNLQCVVFASGEIKLPLNVEINRATSEMYEINRSQPTSPKSPMKYNAIISKLDRLIRDEDYSDINQKVVQKLDREDCSDCLTIPFIGIAAAILFDYSHDMINCYSRWSCEKRLKYALELKDCLDKKNK